MSTQSFLRVLVCFLVISGPVVSVTLGGTGAQDAYSVEEKHMVGQFYWRNVLGYRSDPSELEIEHIVAAIGEIPLHVKYLQSQEVTHEERVAYFKRLGEFVYGKVILHDLTEYPGLIRWSADPLKTAEIKPGKISPAITFVTVYFQEIKRDGSTSALSRRLATRDTRRPRVFVSGEDIEWRSILKMKLEPAPQEMLCPKCRRPMHFRWRFCPYDATALRDGARNTTEKRTATTEATEPLSQLKSNRQRAGSQLTVVVTTPLLQVFSLKEYDLTVTISGPTTRTKTEKSIATATAKSFVFSGIPVGKYTITATYGKKAVKKKVNVSGDTYEFQITF